MACTPQQERLEASERDIADFIFIGMKEEEEEEEKNTESEKMQNGKY